MTGPILYNEYSFLDFKNKVYKSNYPCQFRFDPLLKFSRIRKAFSHFGLKDKSSLINIPIHKFFIKSIFSFVKNIFNKNYESSVINVFKYNGDCKDILDNTELVFSANPWDIATMSMRGIASCMTWGNTRSESLNGSIVDPFCAVIYLSSDKLRSMDARSVVRLVKDGDEFKILLERVYLSKFVPYFMSRTLAYMIFSEYLSSMSGLKVIPTEDILLPSGSVNENIVIPYDSELDVFKNLELSYRDSRISYSNGR